MKTILSFLGWQRVPGLSGRGIALFNEPEGSTITLTGALERFPDGFEISASVVAIWCETCKRLEFLRECETGFDLTTNAAEAWLIGERAYDMQLAAKILAGLSKVVIPNHGHQVRFGIVQIDKIASAFPGSPCVFVGDFFLHESIV